jgi:hypothetical protein
VGPVAGNTPDSGFTTEDTESTESLTVTPQGALWAAASRNTRGAFQLIATSFTE